ncbi:hypothetical protein [Kitasatospora purpeofusca]|uniref:hypothetical protein n=1 Tax=Kitasatospora purpeofusca TaxID=67352 RepID=UPI0036D22A1E
MTARGCSQVSPTSDVLAGVRRRVEAYRVDKVLPCGPTTPCEAGVPVSPDDLKGRACDGTPGDPGRIAAWRHVGYHVREESEADGERIWTLTAVWLLAPRLRGAAYAIVRRTGAERADVGSALLVGVLEGARTIGERSEDIEQDLMDAAFAAGWRTGRRGSKEIPVGEWEAVGEAAEPLFAARTAHDVVSVGAMSGRLLQRAQGERLGALAHRLGLLPHVREVRRSSRSRAGQPHRGAGRVLGEQPALFEMPETGGSAREGLS